MRRRVITLCVLTALGLSACGGDDKDKTAASTAPPTTVSAAADLEKAKRVVLVAADFPPGWTAEPDDEPETAEDRAASQVVNACVGTSGDEAETAEWSGDTFSMGAYQVGTEVAVVRDEAIFRKDVDAIKGPKLQTCLKDALTKVLTDELGEPPTSVEVAPLEVAQYGDVTVGVRVTATLTARGEAETIYADAILMGKNRAEATTSFFSVGEPIDPGLQQSLIAKAGARVNAA